MKILKIERNQEFVVVDVDGYDGFKLAFALDDVVDVTDFKAKIKAKIAEVDVIKNELLGGESLQLTNQQPSFVLVAEGIVTVTVKGKTGAGWIKERSGTWNSTAPNHKFRICVPAMQALGKYYYEVTVTGVGNLDPRVDVN